MLKWASTESLARLSSRRPWTTIGIWLLVFSLAIFLVATLLKDGETTDFVFVNNPESKKGFDLIEKHLRDGPIGTNEVIIVQSETLTTVDDPAFEQLVSGLFRDVKALGPDVIRVETVTNYYDAGLDVSLVSQDRRTTIMPFIMAGDFDDASDNISKVVEVVDAANKDQGEFKVLITGQATLGLDFREVGDEDLLRGEVFGVPIALLILVLVLGGLVAALMPVVLAAVSIVVALGAASLVGQAFALSFFVENVTTMIGLAVGIDYSLFILSRYREERARGLEKLDAIGRAGATATRTVLFSGMTVVLALIGMLLIPFNIFIGIGIGAIFVVIAAVLASMTPLPAGLSLLGDGVDKLSIPWIGKMQRRFDEERQGGFWDRVSRGVMRQPVVSIMLAGGLLIAAAVPFLDLHIGFAGVSTMPDDVQSKQGFLILDKEFSQGEVTPAEIVIDGDIGSQVVQAAIESLKTAMATDKAFGQPRPLEVSEGENVALLSVPVTGDSASRQTQEAIKRLRKDYIPTAFKDVPAKVHVTGETAFNLDFFALSKRYAPLVITFVLVISFLLLMIVFRSIVVPIKAIILNLLSVGATYGILVLVFQKDVLHGALGFQQSDIVEAWIPLFLFTILFGLSMDYHVFLLSRIRERYDQTLDNTGSVAFGVRSTGRLITGAALIMVSVFWGFSAGDLVGLQQMGFGLGTAILLDATIVRMVLVPASMKLLGKWNWYLPRALHWLPDFRVERTPEEATPASDD